MSYDLDLFTPEKGVDPIYTIMQIWEQEEEAEEIYPGEPIPEFEQRKQVLVEALLQLDPDLKVFTFGFGEIAAAQGISEAEARKRYRHIELNRPKGGNGIQITLYDVTASITVPYWHHGAKARETWNEIWGYLRLIQGAANFVTYDPQLDKVLDLSSDFNAVISLYEGVTSQFGGQT